MIQAPSLIERAMRIAIVAHEKQTRKGDNFPYIIHPLMVATKLMQNDFSDIVIAAALTHDVLEDTSTTEQELIESLGDDVVTIVKTVSEGKNLIWEERKKKYVEAVRRGSQEAKAVSVADKIHNAESFLFAYKREGDVIFKYFHGGMSQRLWFEELMLQMLQETWQHPLIDEYEILVKQIKNL